MKIINGDLIQLTLDGQFDVVIHGCNCFHKMGAGVARAIRDAFPEAYKMDLATMSPPNEKLGTISWAPILRNGNKFTIVNAYTQLYYGRSGVHVDYDALRRTMKQVKQVFSGRRIGYPMIGCGLAGGDWNTVSRIIDEELEGEDHTLVKFIK